MRLQLLIPHYRETAEEMRPLLDSIAIQQAVSLDDVGVVVAFDGPDAYGLPIGEWRHDYPFSIDEVVLPEHAGVSSTRNAALDIARADYVMFCDADDMLYNACGLYILMREMERGFDVLISRFTEETRLDGRPWYTNHECDSTFVHGKCYRRSYLIDHGIRFDGSLTVHEDSYFVTLAQECAADVRYCPTPFYLWRWRDASVCRHDPDYILKTYGNLIDSMDALSCEFARRGMADKARFRVGVAVMDAYYTLNKPEWRDVGNAEYRDAVERRFAAFFKAHRAEWEALSDAERMLVSQGIRARTVAEGMGMESVTLAQWLDTIGGII
jgi:glycosyltransferase involved in cell wall biosynthesis